MPAQTTRKIMRHGSSGVIAIPADYRRYYNLEHGSEVVVLYDSVVLIVPKTMERTLEMKRDVIRQLLEGHG